MEAKGIAKVRTLFTATTVSITFAAVAVVLLVWFFVLAAPALGGVLPATHDFALMNPGGQPEVTTRTCGVCHIPTSGRFSQDQAVQALNPSEAYTGALNGKYSTGSSRLCLGCHDGTISVQAWGLRSKWGNDAVAVTTGADWKDHPVDVPYRPGKDFKVISNSKIRLYNGIVGCGTCHDVHGEEAGVSGTGVGTGSDGGGFPLREENHNSRLCLECHDK